MTTDLHLAGPTVTLFGDRDALGAAISDELGRRGCSTHSVTTPMGWLASVTHAIVRLDTRAGEQALSDLTSREMPATHVVAVCATSDDELAAARLDHLCRQCGDSHDVSMIWHAPFGLPTGSLDGAMVRASELASSIADHIGSQDAAPAFSSSTFAPSRPPSAH
ncbi:hypothetical protein [Aeromicrobium endophyticum]|uniref:Uncharacterized protein n=1 Tax=Aeromicrobium endophyticum TaxID=2292704 RepID=A0A371PAL3_9ACTN|nr:hypothetical protein [Aeromicrobium endophyticum]REK72941.1 hypothetical protein DX116_04940 [Aeromicrobium endophyticum]